jgi:DNA-binding transcriptional MerR regulator
MTRTVGEVARLAGITIRTLHHYDNAGLLVPAGRSEAGYRLYADADLERLQQILAYRQLGFELEEIRELLDDPAVDTVGHLERQAALLAERAAKLESMRQMIAKMLEARKMGINLSPEEILEVFGDHDPTEHAAEAEERWGKTDAYAESQRRTRGYGKEDWLQIQREMDAVHQQLISLLNSGAAATSAAALDAAEAHRQQISRWFYPCSPEMHRGLADMYVSDPRFTKTYEDMAAGLAQFLADAIHANAERS